MVGSLAVAIMPVGAEVVVLVVVLLALCVHGSLVWSWMSGSKPVNALPVWRAWRAARNKRHRCTGVWVRWRFGSSVCCSRVRWRVRGRQSPTLLTLFVA